MASITTVSGTNTPNEGRLIWNENFDNLNTEVGDNSSLLAAVGGNIVGTSQAQILTNKTLVSSNRGGTNSINISRQDLESTALFLVTSDSGSVSDIDVSGGSQYSLQILGDNGLDSYVTSNVLYLRNSETCIMNETSQVLGVKVASVTSGNVAEFGGNILVNNYLGVGSGHSAAASAEVHLKDSTPELRIETSSTYGYFSYRDSGGDNFTWTADFTGGTENLILSYNGTQLITVGNSSNSLVFSQDLTLSKVGGSHTIVGDLDVQGILTAGGLIAVATDVVINNGPVTISGGTSFIDDGAIEHDKLALTSSGYLLIGSGSGVPTAVPISGDISLGYTGEVTIENGVVTMPMMASQDLHTMLGGTGSGVAALTNNTNSDLTFATTGTTFTLTFKTNRIVNEDINSAANISMSKTAFDVNISGVVMNGNTLELAPGGPKSDILFRDVPIGTIIPYAGTIASLSSTGFVEPVTGWLFCNGYIIDTGAHPELSTLQGILGTAWGSTGQLPDMMGYFLRGVDPTNTVDPDSERTGGDAVNIGSYQVDQVGYHNHDIRPFATTTPPGGNIYTGAGTTGTLATEYYGDPGDQTRPRNKGIAYLIKY